jgi:hypothetical protein
VAVIGRRRAHSGVGFMKVVRSTQDVAMIWSPHGTKRTMESRVAQVPSTFRPGTRFYEKQGTPAFFDSTLATGQGQYCLRRLDTRGYWLDHDVAPNGSYSDLTVPFEFLPLREGFTSMLQTWSPVTQQSR